MYASIVTLGRFTLMYHALTFPTTVLDLFIHKPVYCLNAMN